MTWKRLLLTCLCYISTIFKDIDLKFCTHIHETLPSNICYGFLKILIWGKLSRKGKKLTFFWKFSKTFKILKIRDSIFFWVISYQSIDRSLKTAPVAAIPVNPFCLSKSAKHDVTLTSLTADLLLPGFLFVDTRCGIVARRGMASFKAKFPVFQELFAKTTGALCPPPAGGGQQHRGPPNTGGPPPSGARDNTGEGQLRSPGKKVQTKTKTRDLELWCMF